MAKKVFPHALPIRKGGVFSSLWLQCAILSVFGAMTGVLLAWMIAWP